MYTSETYVGCGNVFVPRELPNMKLVNIFYTMNLHDIKKDKQF